MFQGGDTRESQLQNLLTEERDKCNQYKHIYETLKEKHVTLCDELTLIYEKLKEANDQNEKLRSASESNAHKLESRVKEQQIEINALNERLKFYDDKRIQAGVFEEAATHYEAKIKDLYTEADKIRNQYNNLHYENAILKCKFDSREAEYSRALERINLQHQGEIELLQDKIEAFEKEKSAPTETYALELKSSKREVLQLSSRVKSLLSECEELRAQNENLSLQVSSITRTNAKQMSDHLTNIKLLESEKLKATMQREILEKELVNAQEHRKFLNNELQASRLEIRSLKSRCEECEHKYRQVKTNLQVEIEQWKSTKESQQEQFVDEISRLKSELQSLNTTVSQERLAMLDKEEDLQQKISVERQHFWKQTRELNQEKEKLQNKVKELETNIEAITSNRKQDTQELKQKLQQLIVEKAELGKELLVIKEKTAKEKELSGCAERNDNPSKRNLDYERAIQDLKDRIDLLSAGSSTEKRFQDTVAKSNGYSEHEIMHLKLSWEQQKLQYQQRLDELESQLREFKTSTAAEKRELDFKVKQYSKKVNGLQEKLELQKLLNEELEHQKNSLEKVHAQLQNQLTELQRRMEKYRQLIATDPSTQAKTTFPGLTFPERMLADIKNIPFQSFLPQTTSNQTESPQMLPEKLKEDTRKSLQPRRKSVKARDRKRQIKSVSPVFSSSSDLENL